MENDPYRDASQRARMRLDELSTRRTGLQKRFDEARATLVEKLRALPAFESRLAPRRVSLEDREVAIAMTLLVVFVLLHVLRSRFATFASDAFWACSAIIAIRAFLRFRAPRVRVTPRLDPMEVDVERLPEGFRVEQSELVKQNDELKIMSSEIARLRQSIEKGIVRYDPEDKDVHGARELLDAVRTERDALAVDTRVATAVLLERYRTARVPTLGGQTSDEKIALAGITIGGFLLAWLLLDKNAVVVLAAAIFMLVVHLSTREGEQHSRVQLSHYDEHEGPEDLQASRRAIDRTRARIAELEDEIEALERRVAKGETA